MSRRSRKIAARKAKAAKRARKLAAKARKRTFKSSKPAKRSGVRTGGSTSSRYNRSTSGRSTSLVKRGGVYGRR